MKQFIALLYVLLNVTIVIGQPRNSTYYYEKVAQVQNGQSAPASGDGHYLTMNSNILYESNPDGTYLNLGMMQFEGDYDGMHTYGGNAYLGNGLTYYFASDYSRLNIRLYDGTVLVYERKSQANNSQMRQYTSLQNNGNNHVETPIVIIESGNSNNNTTTKHQDTNVHYVTCPYCNGKTFVAEERSFSVSSYGIDNSHDYVTCSCGKRYDRKNTVHTHRTCPKCNGSGKIPVK